MRRFDMDARIAGEGEDRFEEPGVADEIPAPRRDWLPRDRRNGGGGNGRGHFVGTRVGRPDDGRFGRCLVTASNQLRGSAITSETGSNTWSYPRKRA